MLTRLSSKQSGIGGTALMAVGLSLLVMAAITVNGFKQASFDLKMAKAKAQGQQLKEISDAMNTYMVKNFAVLACGPTNACGSVAGVPNKLSPTIAELKAIGILDYSVQPTSVYNTGVLTQVATVPTGCAGSNCSLTSLVYTASPVIDPAALTVEGSVLGQAIISGGADVGASVSAGNINGLNGTWSVLNPVSGQPAGILAARSGAGSAFDPTAYLRRDGTLPMSGTFQTAGNAIDMAGGNVNNANQVNASKLSAGTAAVSSLSAANITASADVTSGTVTLKTVNSIGSACSANGQLALSSGNDLLICKAGTWQTSGGGGLGYGQTWQLVSRAGNVTYTNDTGKPIMVSAMNYYAPDGGIGLYVDGMRVCLSGQDGGQGNDYHTCTAVVPAGSTYSIEPHKWNSLTTYELR